MNTEISSKTEPLFDISKYINVYERDIMGWQYDFFPS